MPEEPAVLRFKPVNLNATPAQASPAVNPEPTAQPPAAEETTARQVFEPQELTVPRTPVIEDYQAAAIEYVPPAQPYVPEQGAGTVAVAPAAPEPVTGPAAVSAVGSVVAPEPGAELAAPEPVAGPAAVSAVASVAAAAPEPAPLRELPSRRTAASSSPQHYSSRTDTSSDSDPQPKRTFPRRSRNK